MNKLPIYSLSVTLYDLDQVKERLTKKQLDDIEKKSKDILGTIYAFSNYESRLLAERMLQYGMLAAHVTIGVEGVEPEPARIETSGDFTIETSPLLFNVNVPMLYDDVKAHVQKRLRSQIYQEAVSRELEHTLVGDKLVKCAMMIDTSIPMGEVHFYYKGMLVQKLVGVKHDY